MHVWVRSSSNVTAAALAELVRARGFFASTRREPMSEVVLWDLSGEDLVGENPVSDGPMRLGGRALRPLPTLVLVLDEAAGARVFRLGYRGYLTRRADGEALERALLAVSRGGVWAGDHPLHEAPPWPPE